MQELPGDFAVGVTVGVGVLAAAHECVLGSQLLVKQSVSFLQDWPPPPGSVHTPSEPKMSQRSGVGHVPVLQQVLLTQFWDTHCLGSSHMAPVGCGVGVIVGVGGVGVIVDVRVTVSVGVFVGRIEQLPS